MKRTPLRRKVGLKRGTKLRLEGVSDTSELKRDIQTWVRKIVIVRDGGCVLQNHPDAPQCNGYAADGHLILQADHLITRANSATYADTRLIVCVCKGHHGWKKWHEARYNECVKERIGRDRVQLWERAHLDRYKPTPMRTNDWKLALVALKHELTQLEGGGSIKV